MRCESAAWLLWNRPGYLAWFEVCPGGFAGLLCPRRGLGGFHWSQEIAIVIKQIDGLGWIRVDKSLTRMRGDFEDGCL